VNPVQQARALRAQGFRVVPTIDKVASTEGFGAEDPDFTRGPEWFGEPGTQVGILCGPCPALAPDHLLCVDIDGDPEDNPEMITFLDLLPAVTLESHDGRHLFFRVAPEAASQLGQWGLFKRPGRKHDGIDLKWAGGYACEAWDWAPGTSTDALATGIAKLPADALAAILSARTTRPTQALALRGIVANPTDGPNPSLEEAGFDRRVVKADARAWLLSPTAPLPTDGTGGATLLVIMGALLIGFGLDEEDVLELAIDVYAPRAWPDEDPDEDGIARKLDEIDRLGSDRFEWLELAAHARTVRDGAALTRPDALQAAIEALPPGTPKDALDQAYYTWNARLERTAKGLVKTGANNIHISLDVFPSWAGLFGYDDFAKEVTYLRTPDKSLGLPASILGGAVFDEDNHVFAIKVWISKLLGYEANTSLVIEAVHHVARKRIFHPVRDWLGALPPWDGVDRNLAAYLGAEQTPYHRAVCAKWLRSAVARALVPGCKADTMLILEGKQGARKSTAIRCLCPDTRWFYEAASREVGGKDFMQDMRGKWLCEIPEVDQLIRSRDESELKAFLSRVTDNYRPSYARKSQDFARQLVSAGTTNHGSYLRDETGNRRYWPIRCGEVGPILDGAICDDRAQLWAQARAEYNAGLPWWLSADEDAAASGEQDERLEEDPWAGPLQLWIETRGGESFTTVEALGSLPGAKPAGDLTGRDIGLMSKTLRNLGWVLGAQHRVAGQRVRRWELTKK
jgi:virulence-associated protein E